VQPCERLVGRSFAPRSSPRELRAAGVCKGPCRLYFNRENDTMKCPYCGGHLVIRYWNGEPVELKDGLVPVEKTYIVCEVCYRDWAEDRGPSQPLTLEGAT